MSTLHCAQIRNSPLNNVEEETDSAKQSDTSGVMSNKAEIYFDSSELWLKIRRTKFSLDGGN